MIRRGVSAFVIAALAAATLISAPSSRVAWTLETVKRVRGGDVARGKKLHVDQDCAGCHGEAGNVDIPDVPDLGGQDPLYTYKQLADYLAGTRESSIMNEAVKPLSDRDLIDLAAFYAAQPLPPASPAPPNPGAAAIKLASIGDGARLIPACDACHGERGAGNPGFYGMPALKNQKLQDVVVQMRAFRSGERRNDVYRVMRDVSKALSDPEIDALASYYSGTKAEPTP